MPAVAAPTLVAEAPPPLPTFPSRRAEPAPAAPPLVVPHPGSPKVVSPSEPRHSTPSLLPSRPPLRVEDGLIEVGWAGGLESEELDEIEELDEYEDTSDDGQLVDDHYAALQAWAEWARNRDRLSRPTPAPAEVETEPDVRDEDEAEEPDSEADSTAEAEAHSTAEASADARDARDDESALGDDLRAEPPHDHAPYGQLFGKMRLSN
jgi:general secretion pathway protein A